MSVGLLFDFQVSKWEYDYAVEALVVTWPYLGVTRLLVFPESKILALKQCCSTTRLKIKLLHEEDAVEGGH